MANEIAASIALTVKKGFLSASRSTSRNFDITAGSPAKASGIVSVPTTAAGTAISLGSVATAGWARFENVDPTNYVEVGVQVSGTFYALVKLKPGEFALFRMNTSNTPYWRANTTAALVDYEIYDN